MNNNSNDIIRPLNAAIESPNSFNKQLELYYKISFIYLYQELKKQIINILEYKVSKSIAFIIFNFITIDKNAYIPKKYSRYREVDPIIEYNLMLWSKSLSIRLYIINPYTGHMIHISNLGMIKHNDKDTPTIETMQIIKTKLYINSNCDKILQKYNRVFTKYYNNHLQHKDKNRNKFSDLIYLQKNYQNTNKQIKNITNYNNIKCKTYKLTSCLDWFEYSLNDSTCFHRLYYDMCRLFIYINY